MIDRFLPAESGTQTATVIVAGLPVRVAYRGEGAPLLLINGLGANLEMWETLVKRIPGHRHVMFDFPGTGDTPNLPRRARMPALATFVEQLMDALDLPHADVLGYSWGGALAQQLAYQAPHRVDRLILAATTCGMGGRPPAPWVVGAMATPLRYYSPTYLKLIAPFIYGASIRDDAAHTLARRNRPPSARGYLNQLYAISGWSSRSWLRSIRSPTLILSGQRDRVAPPRNGAILANGIRAADLVVVPGGHLFLLQGANPAFRLIREFLSAS